MRVGMSSSGRLGKLVATICRSVCPALRGQEHAASTWPRPCALRACSSSHRHHLITRVPSVAPNTRPPIPESPHPTPPHPTPQLQYGANKGHSHICSTSCTQHPPNPYRTPDPSPLSCNTAPTRARRTRRRRTASSCAWCTSWGTATGTTSRRRSGAPGASASTGSSRAARRRSWGAGGASGRAGLL